MPDTSSGEWMPAKRRGKYHVWRAFPVGYWYAQRWVNEKPQYQAFYTKAEALAWAQEPDERKSA